MVTIDTNILVRLLTHDNEEEFQRAYRLFQQERVLVPTTVVLETEWVLRYAYGFSPDRVIAALRGCFGLAGVELEESDRVSTALGWHEQGLDFADALHLACGRVSEAFCSLDKKLVRRARRITGLDVRFPE